MNSIDQLEGVKALYAAFGRGDVATVLGSLHPDILWVNPGPDRIAYFGEHRGRDAVARNVFGFLAENIDIRRLEPYAFLAEGERAVVLIKMEAVARRTGRGFAQDVAHVWMLSEGRPIRFHDFQNNYAIVEALEG